MLTPRIDRIEKIIVEDASSPTGKRIIGFHTFYEDSRWLYSQSMFGKRMLRFFDAEEQIHEVELDPRIEELDIYHSQYGIVVSDAHHCFFVSSWLKGIYCCDLTTGQIRWNHRLKHGTKVFLYPDYIICAFQEIGLRKLSYDGNELAKYAAGTYNACYAIEDPYVFIGPSRNTYFLVDTASMNVYKRIRQSSFAPADENLIIHGAMGSAEKFNVTAYCCKSEQMLSLTICPE